MSNEGKSLTLAPDSVTTTTTTKLVPHIHFLDKAVDRLPPGEIVGSNLEYTCVCCDQMHKGLWSPMFYLIGGMRYLIGWISDKYECKGRHTATTTT